MLRGSLVVGQTFGHLTILGKAARKYSDSKYYYSCQCDCGNIIDIEENRLKSGNVTSCGCTKIKIRRKNKTNFPKFW